MPPRRPEAKVSFLDVFRTQRPKQKRRPQPVPQPPVAAAVLVAPVATPEPPPPPAPQPSLPPAPSEPVPVDSKGGEAATSPADPEGGSTGNKDIATASANGEWTKEDDAELLELKDTKKLTWKAIQAAMTKFTLKEIKARYKTLKNPGSVLVKGEKGDATNKDDKKKFPSEAELKENQKSALPLPTQIAISFPDQNSYVDPGTTWNVVRIGGAAKSSHIGWYRPDEWTKEEVNLLQTLASSYEKNRWLDIASRFYDITGIRVNPEAVREKLA
ncbi:MAG: hypothetical protein M1825_003818 [Sarcosagium campestre]|nr:MAG: hypothetical protein M1825_003818 [Sarcosagium campestre]